MLSPIACPVCSGTCPPLDVVDFNKSCAGDFVPSGIAIQYVLCDHCHFCFAPQFRDWKLSDFEEKIYNKDYVSVDPDYLDLRPRNNANSLLSIFGEHGSRLRHLDFGGGDGLLSKTLQGASWNSSSYDPFVDLDVDPSSLGRFDLITAFEVFEHIPDVCQLIETLSSLLSSNGIVLFSTLVSDGNIAPRQPLSWWYAAPRNGHISLFSRRSLAMLGAREGFTLGSLSDSYHAFWTHVPDWARHYIRVA